MSAASDEERVARLREYQFKPGADPRRGKGVKGRSGRKPQEYTEYLKSLEPKALRALEKYLDRPHGVAGLRAIQEVLDRTRGKAVTPLEHSGSLDHKLDLMSTEELKSYFVKLVLEDDFIRTAVVKALEESPPDDGG